MGPDLDLRRRRVTAALQDDMKATGALTRVLTICNQEHKPEPEIVDLWGPNGPDLPPNPSEKVEGKALHFFGKVWEQIGPMAHRDPKNNDFRIRPKPWLQIATTLVSVPVAYELITLGILRVALSGS